MSLERVSESFDFSGGTVDESGPYPVIRGVLLCGLTSEHGYDYLPSAWTDPVLKLYEGASSYEGHKAGARLPSEKVGWFENVRRRSDGRPEADYYLEPDHPMCKRVLRAAKHNPRAFALSHQAGVDFGTRNGRKVVESIGYVASVDLVSRGGTTGGIFEHGTGEQHVGAKVTTVKEYADKLGAKCTIEQLLKLRTLVQEDGFAAAPMGPDAPDPGAEGTTADDGITAAFKSAFDMVRDKLFSGEMDKKTALKKLSAIFDGHGNAQDAADEPEPEPKPKVEESGAGKPAAADPWELVEECEREKFTPSATDLKALKLMPVREDRAAFISQQKGLRAGTDPKSAGRAQLNKVEESGNGGGKAEPTGVEGARAAMAALSASLRGVKPSAN